MAEYITQGVSLFSGAPNTLTPVAAAVKVPQEGRGWAHVQVQIGANAADTCTVAIHGRMSSAHAYTALTKSDNTTAFSVAQAAGAAVNVMSQVQLMPDMIVVLTGTRTAGSNLKVSAEMVSGATRADS